MVLVVSWSFLISLGIASPLRRRLESPATARSLQRREITPMSAMGAPAPLSNGTGMYILLSVWMIAFTWGAVYFGKITKDAAQVGSYVCPPCIST